MAADEFIKGIEITCLRPPDVDEIVIRRRFNLGRGRHGRMVLGTKAGTWQRGSLSAASLPSVELVSATDLIQRGIDEGFEFAASSFDVLLLLGGEQGAHFRADPRDE